ncbi:hypothetical protein ACW0JT_00050 [Arthrobacter sp. SA17]
MESQLALSAMRPSFADCAPISRTPAPRLAVEPTEGTVIQSSEPAGQILTSPSNLLGSGTRWLPRFP